jgi:hypothetical protein
MDIMDEEQQETRSRPPAEPGRGHDVPLDQLARALQRMTRVPWTEPERRRRVLKVLARHHRCFVGPATSSGPEAPGF